MPRREWLVTNGLGGYASGTVAGVVTRRYHGLLVAALPAPLGRYRHAESSARARAAAEPARSRGSATKTKSRDRTPSIARGHLVEFRLELGLPVWRYELDGLVIEKRM